MNYPFDDDELIRAAYVIPDLRVSDIQKDGPLYLPKDGDFNKPRYFQTQSKFKSFYTIRAAVRFFLTVHRKFEKINKGYSVEVWKTETFVEELEKNEFEFEEKTKNFFRVLERFWKRRVEKGMFCWKMLSGKCRIAKRVIGRMKELEGERREWVRENEGLRKEVRSVEEKIKSVGRVRSEVGGVRGLGVDGLLKLRRENALLVHKLDQAGKVFNGYLQQIQGLLH